MKSGETKESLKNALWALGFAMGVWFLVDQNMRETIEEVPATLAVYPPEGISVAFIDPEGGTPRAFVAISAPRNVLDKRSEWTLQGTYNISAPVVLGKEIPIPLSEFRFNLPPEADLVEKLSHPPSVRIVLAEQKRASLTVDVVYANVPTGWEVDQDSVIAEPPIIDATGPKDVIGRDPHVKTEPIDVRKQFEYKHWKLTDSRERQLDLAGVLTHADVGVKVAGVVRVSMLVKPALSERSFDVVPEIVAPVPGLVFKDPVTLKDVAYRLDPPAGSEKVTVTLRGLEADLEQLKDPKIREERGFRVLAIVPREAAVLFPKRVGLSTPLPVDVKLPDGVTLKGDKKLTYDVTVNLVESPAPQPVPPPR